MPDRDQRCGWTKKGSSSFLKKRTKKLLGTSNNLGFRAALAPAVSALDSRLRFVRVALVFYPLLS